MKLTLRHKRVFGSFKELLGWWNLTHQPVHKPPQAPPRRPAATIKR